MKTLKMINNYKAILENWKQQAALSRETLFLPHPRHQKVFSHQFAP